MASRGPGVALEWEDRSDTYILATCLDMYVLACTDAVVKRCIGIFEGTY